MCVLRRPDSYRLQRPTLRLRHQRPPAVHQERKDWRQRIRRHQVARGLLDRRHGQLDLPRHHRRGQDLLLVGLALRCIVGAVGHLAHQCQRRGRVLPLLRQQRRQRRRAESAVAHRPVEVTPVETDDRQQHTRRETLQLDIRSGSRYRRERPGMDSFRRRRSAGYRLETVARQLAHRQTEPFNDRSGRLGRQHARSLSV